MDRANAARQGAPRATFSRRACLYESERRFQQTAVGETHTITGNATRSPR